LGNSIIIGHYLSTIVGVLKRFLSETQFVRFILWFFCFISAFSGTPVIDFLGLLCPLFEDHYLSFLGFKMPNDCDKVQSNKMILRRKSKTARNVTPADG
jgi:hypothetical protein